MRVAVEAAGVRANLVAIFLHPGDAVCGGDDRIGMFRCKCPAAWRSSGLDENWPPLRRRYGIERAATLEEFTLEMDRMDLSGIGIDPALAIHDHRVGFPRVEQATDQIDIFICHCITHLARRQLVDPEILRRGILAAGDDVPAETAAGDGLGR